jgi:uncharacterized protein YggT (Ycf19 family)
MALLLLIAQTLLFVAAMALVGQFLVGLFSWRRRHENVIYQLFGMVARPVVRAVRVVTPRLVLITTFRSSRSCCARWRTSPPGSLTATSACPT